MLLSKFYIPRFKILFMLKSSIFLFFLILFSCRPNQGEILDFTINIVSYNLSGSGDLIFDKPHHVVDDTLFSFDIYQRKITKVPLNFGPNESIDLSFNFDSSPNEFYYINYDSILFSTGSELFLTDQKGNRYHSVKLFEKLNDIKNEVYTEFPFSGFAKHLFFNKTSNSVLFYFAKKSQTDDKKVFGEINLNNGKWRTFDSFHPQEYMGVPLNYTTFPSVTWTPKGFAFIYSISPTIVSVDTVINDQNEFQISSFEGKQSAEPQTNRDLWSSEYFEDWVLTSPNYLKILYDPVRNLYYRFSQAPLNQSPEGGEYFYDFLIKNADVYLTILTSDFKVVYNEKLPKGKYDPTRSLVFSKGLWVPHEISIVENENFLYGDLFQITQLNN